MSETFPEGTSQGTDYGSTVDRVEDAGEQRTEGGATPDAPEAERAQEGVQEAFE
ncbi:MAG TPA: hypothetical protein VGX28_02990 [Frankiaceae bacterium]|jgi:hypothetical protein|nr:hypothetical protein [Frankiaceae bacterium]